MNHPSEDRLLLFHYEGDRAVEGHMGSCPACRQRLETLRGFLAAVERAAVPEREDSYGREVWRRIAPRLRQRPGSRSTTCSR